MAVGLGLTRSWGYDRAGNQLTRTAVDKCSQARAAAATSTVPALCLPRAATPTGTTARGAERGCEVPWNDTSVTGVSKATVTGEPGLHLQPAAEEVCAGREHREAAALVVTDEPPGPARPAYRHDHGQALTRGDLAQWPQLAVSQGHRHRTVARRAHIDRGDSAGEARQREARERGIALAEVHLRPEQESRSGHGGKGDNDGKN